MTTLARLISLFSKEKTGITISEEEFVRLYPNTFVLNDDKACADCRQSAECNRATLIVSSDYPVECIDVSVIYSYLPQKEKQALKNCDYILSDGEEQYGVRKVTFCDLACTERRYVESGTSHHYPEGKREYVVKQMLSTMNFFQQDSLLKHNILTATRRQFVFGWREKPTASADVAAKRMRGFFHHTKL